MKHLLRSFIAVVLAVIIGTLIPLQVIAESPDYISEIKIAMGDDAEADLKGYIILKDGDNAVDLNQKAGSDNVGSKGQNRVILGYKTTKNRSEAISDIAVMNMRGGYDVAEYTALFETYIKSQVAPLVLHYIDMLKEYRANYESGNAYNKAKAQYVHDALNYFIDDDTGKGLGDLFLAETKEELGDAYNGLSAAEKKGHADLTTIISQSNGNATLLMQALLARACDTDDATLLDRFTELSYDKLVDSTGLTPTDAEKELSKLYNDDAQTLLYSWKDLRVALEGYDDAVKVMKNYDEKACQKAISDFDKLNEKSSEDEINRVTDAYNKALTDIADVIAAGEVVALHDKLAATEFEDGTMLDFFTQNEEEIEDDITVLYPLVASLSDGQRAGLEFVSLYELLLMVLTDREGYKSASLENLSETSIYAGVDRNIYNMGGVAITTDARRSGIMEDALEDSGATLSVWPFIVGGLAIVSAAAALGSGLVLSAAKETVNIALRNYETVFDMTEEMFSSGIGEDLGASQIAARMDPMWANDVAAAKSTARLWTGLTVGFSVAFVVLSVITVYLTYSELCAYYNVEFSPIPHYMIDEKDLIGYNKKGEKVLIKNQSAYYKAVECNRTDDDEMYEILGTCADLNGDVGRQWLALYAVKNEALEPILADSLKVVVGSDEIPGGYSTGIHMFGADSAFNLNTDYYVWNNSAPAVYVYFKTDDKAATAAGANFTAGTLAITGGAGIILGAALTAVFMNSKKKKEEV